MAPPSPLPGKSVPERASALSGGTVRCVPRGSAVRATPAATAVRRAETGRDGAVPGHEAVEGAPWQHGQPGMVGGVEAVLWWSAHGPVWLGSVGPPVTPVNGKKCFWFLDFQVCYSSGDTAQTSRVC